MQIPRFSKHTNKVYHIYGWNNIDFYLEYQRSIPRISLLFFQWSNSITKHLIQFFCISLFLVECPLERFSHIMNNIDFMGIYPLFFKKQGTRPADKEISRFINRFIF